MNDNEIGVGDVVRLKSEATDFNIKSNSSLMTVNEVNNSEVECVYKHQSDDYIYRHFNINALVKADV